MPQKASSGERELCRDFSRWWTNGRRDDVFWRTSGSGARAKYRGRQGKGTRGQHGDIAATDPIGDPLTDLLTIEFKRGYSKYTIMDVVDRPPTHKQQQWDKWFQQVWEAHQQAGSYTWMMIHRRDWRPALVYMPMDLLLVFSCDNDCAFDPYCLLHINALLMHESGSRKEYESLPLRVVVTTLPEWFRQVTPEMIRRAAKEV